MPILAHLVKCVIDGKRSAATNYFASIFIACLAVGFLLWFDAKSREVMSVTIFAAAILSALLGGIGPGVIASVIGVLGLDYFFIGPGVWFESRSTYVDLAFSLVIVVLISAIIGILRAHYVTERVESVARDRVIGIVSHDLRNPLTAIQTYANLLLSDKAKDPSEVIQGILRSVERMQRIIGDLLDANRIAAGNFSIEKRVENAKSILDDAIGSVHFLADSKRVRVYSKISSETLTLNCDRARLVQALSNLLQNAIKFSDSGGQVAVSLEDGATAMTFVVEDEGRGITESDLPFIFDQYWTMKAGNPDGAGLGLFIVRGIARSHGGEIFAQNKTLGKGAFFSLVIPKD